MTVEAPDNERRDEGTKRRILVLSAAALAVLLVGAAIGMLITLSVVRQASPPSAESVDVGFAQDMQVHHLQAVTMANWARDHTDDLTVKQLAFDIEQTQLGQVGAMSGWLDVWDQPEQNPEGTYMSWMAGASHGHTSTAESAGVRAMPGMATSQEIAKLRTLTGRELDVYFLQLMLRHHQGGLEMSAYANKHAATPQVRNLSDKVVKGQTAEITLFTDMLTERGAKPL
ncbi:FIG00995041: hypothetical protein [Alloactinosynnema sp. L-07]|uniref:DUF305 domain-containing protein n=1 Tax=Alloactinosynnema sp. L-07 TaxID=1653480 RepID=UPI00065EFEAA|nr:DUF305 domain-containing protein [Alloactinosynnema sp. L-07]CRK59170.1 FIG00995041: hypothetical protein [Alloactinosynnema sp. L-07]